MHFIFCVLELVKLFADDAKLYVKVVNTLAIDELEKAHSLKSMG